jgi:hypothetical protein
MLQWNRRHVLLLLVLAAAIGLTLLNGWLDWSEFLDW